MQNQLLIFYRTCRSSSNERRNEKKVGVVVGQQCKAPKGMLPIEKKALLYDSLLSDIIFSCTAIKLFFLLFLLTKVLRKNSSISWKTAESDPSKATIKPMSFFVKYQEGAQFFAVDAVKTNEDNFHYHSYIFVQSLSSGVGQMRLACFLLHSCLSDYANGNNKHLYQQAECLRRRNQQSFLSITIAFILLCRTMLIITADNT